VVAAARVEEAATSMVDEMAELEALALFRNRLVHFALGHPYCNQNEDHTKARMTFPKWIPRRAAKRRRCPPPLRERASPSWCVRSSVSRGPS